MSQNAALISMETLCTRGNNLKTGFSYMSQNVFIFGYLGGPEGVFDDRAVRPHHRGEIYKMYIFGYSGALGGP